MAVDCAASVEFQVTNRFIAPHFDSARGVTEIYIRDAPNQQTIRHDVDAALTHTDTVIPLNAGIVWIAQDLDLDGNIELVTQISAHLTIYSAPDWILRSEFYWPGFNVVMKPTVVNIDDDPHLEVYATPHAFFVGNAVLIDYDPVADSFVNVSDIPLPYGGAGRPAVGDFDEDGRTEFISGNNDFGYELVEWQDSTLAYIGTIPVTVQGAGFSAVACQPMPDGILRALVGFSATDRGYVYQLLEAVGDNEFQVAALFEEQTGATGIHPCWATDTDCDGLDELVMHFYPQDRVYEWDVSEEQFVVGCTWDADTYGSLSEWYNADLDQNSRSEWVTVNHQDILRVFPDARCVLCDSTGTCNPPDPDCFCFCLADPVCDATADILDVVTAVDVAFRGAPANPDPFPQCPTDRTDVNCDAVTDVLDVVRLVNVAFRNGDPSSEFCQPCL